MKIIIAPDSFKGSLSAYEAACAMSRGVTDVFPEAEVVSLPLADGGEGTARVLTDALGGKMCECCVLDPMGQEIKAAYGIVGDGRLAVVDVAAASGLMHVEECERDALRASSYGTGQLIHEALNQGCREFIIGLGGSATTDAGVGMLSALGVRFYDESGNELSPGGGSLRDLSYVDVTGMDNRISGCRFVVMCDVENVLYGCSGAAYVFSPQKGALSGEVALLDGGLRRFAHCVKALKGIDVSGLRGGGAAGGIGASLAVFLGAELKRGVDVTLDAVGFCRHLENADMVLTGEGKLDEQTMMGKLPFGVLSHARRADVPVVAFGGVVACKSRLLKAGFKDVLCINPTEIFSAEMLRRDVATMNLTAAVSTYLRGVVR